MDAITLQSWGTRLSGMMDDEALLRRAAAENPWFTVPAIRMAISAMLPWFDGDRLTAFRSRYPTSQQARRVGLILAGNLPLVGLHDVLVTLLCGHHALVKPSHKDAALLQCLIAASSPEIRERMTLAPKIEPDGIDFLIGTGSDATARLLEVAFAAVPKLIRRSRFSVAVLSGEETAEELEQLALDILLYHGLGCRNVSNVLVPVDYDLQRLCAALDQVKADFLAPQWADVLRYERALQAMLGRPLIPCERIVLEKCENLQFSKIGVLRVVEYAAQDEVNRQLMAVEGDLQCIVGRNHVPFGKAQFPDLDDFADGVDTMAILTGL